MDEYIVEISGVATTGKQLEDDLYNIWKAFKAILEASEVLKISSEQNIHMYCETKSGIKATITKRV